MNRLALIIALGVVGALPKGAQAIEVIYAGYSTGHLDVFATDGSLLSSRSLAKAYSIGVDDASNVYVSPMFEQTVYRYSPGGPATQFASPTPYPNDPYIIIAGVGIGPDNNLYLGLATSPRRIERFDSNGNSLGSLIAGNGGPPHAFDWDSAGNLYAAVGQSGVLKYAADGSLLGSIPTPRSMVTGVAVDSSDNIFVANSTTVTKYNSAGQVLGSFATGFDAIRIAIDATDTLYVGGSSSSGGNHSVIKKFLADGTSLGTFAGTFNKSTGDNFVTGLVIANLDPSWISVPEPSALILAMIAGVFSCMLRRRA